MKNAECRTSARSACEPLAERGWDGWLRIERRVHRASDPNATRKRVIASEANVPFTKKLPPAEVPQD